MQEIPPGSGRPVDEPELWRAIERHVVASGMSPAQALEALRSDVGRSPDPSRALRNLVRFLDAGFSTSLLREFSSYPVLQQVLVALLSQSQYLADILVRDPQLYLWLTASDAMTRMKGKEELLEESRTAIALFQRVEKKIDAVKRIHRREFLRIGSREILHEADVRTTTAELSSLADAVIQSVLEIGHADLSQRTGAAFPSTLAAVGLGKLGGGELNFSSDIDLMFVYEHDEPLAGLSERITSSFEFYRRLAEFVVRALSEMTAEGHLYRVDLRLRPDGSSGPLVMARRATLTYYETRGELWERQMLLKARIVAGDQDTGQGLLRDLVPFLFPKTQLGSPLEEIARIKRQIEARLGTELNVKLGSGGIRDVEFIVQALQLLNGGSDERLRSRSTLGALDAFEALGFLNPVERASLGEAYEFFRTVEHRLQLLYGLQTHSLPVREDEFEGLARRLGFASAEDLRRALSDHRRRVRLIYDSVFHAPGERDPPVRPGRAGLRRLAAASRGEARGELEALVGRLSADLSLETHPDLSDALERAMRAHGAVVWALRNLQTLAGSQAIRRTLVQSLKKPELASLIHLLTARSSKLSALLASEPLLFETLVSQPEELFGDQSAFTFLRQSDPGRYRRFNEFKASLQLFHGTVSFEAFARSVSALAQELLQDVVERLLAERRVAASLPPLCVVALGKFGGGELTVGSDLDCVVVYRAVPGAESGQAVESVIQEILAAFRALGLYEIDLRLRPEGHNAPLGVELDYLRAYFASRASLWEVQSLVKASVVAGDATFGAEVGGFMRSLVSGARLGEGWVGEILAMREKMAVERLSKGTDGPDLKVGPGGLVDLEFAVQMLQLRYGGDDKGFLVPNTFDAVRVLHERGYLSSAEWRQVMESTIAMRTMETLIRLNMAAPGSALPKDPALLEALARAMQKRDADELRGYLESLRSANRALLESIAKRCAS